MIESTDSVFVEEGEEIEEEFFSDPEQESESVFYEEIEPEIIEPNEIEQEDVFQVTSFTSEVEEAEEIPFDQEELIDAQADPEQTEQEEQEQVVYVRGVNEDSGSESIISILQHVESMLSYVPTASDLARIDSRLDEMNDNLL